MRLIVTSQKDAAGVNIFRELAEHFEADGHFEGKPIFKKGDVRLIATERNQTLANHLDTHFSPEYYVFASRHRSESGEKTLTVHAPGNLTSRILSGGRAKEVAYCSADAEKAALVELKSAKDEMNLDYTISMEATHHGPTELKRPVLFVEVGSSESEWKDERAVSAVARAALTAAENERQFEKAVGIGGKHYAPLHTKINLESKIAIGHIIPSYAIDELEKEMLLQAVERSNAAFGFLDWKGMKKQQKEKIFDFAAQIKLELKRGRDLRSGNYL